MRATLLLCGLTAVVVGQDPAAAAFRPVRLFGDHMVLPAACEVPVRGFGPADARVEIAASWGASGTGVVGEDGRWLIGLQTPGVPPAGSDAGPFEVTLRCGETVVVLRDVLIGDVWLAAGQSNMEWKLPATDDAERTIAAADHPRLRFFHVARTAAGAPLDDVDGEWLAATPANSRRFSAVAYHFAAHLGFPDARAIGVVVSAWGGTVCEAWTSERGLAAFPEFADALANARAAARPATLATQRTVFWRAVAAGIGGARALPTTLPDVWSRTGLGDFDGVAEYRREVPLPRELAGRDLVLALGPIDDVDTVAIDGEHLEGTERDGAWSTPRRYRVPAARTAGKQRIALTVQVLDTGGEGGIGGEPGDSWLGLDGGRRIELGEGWTRARGPALRDLPPWPADARDSPNRPAALWNGMVAPLAPFPFAGAIWYQGESNVGRAEQYARLFPAMIEDWRASFGAQLSFFFVQIAPFRYRDDRGEAAELRLAQAAALALPRTGMVVTLDVGDADDIHPRDKRSVGLRLALQAKKRHYGENPVADGPRAVRASARGSELRVEFEHANGGLAGEPPLSGFEVAGADGIYHPADARLDGGDAVVLRSAAVEAPVAARYAFAAAPEVTLRNGAGLPAAPFVLAVR